MGPLFAWIIKRQFENLRNGDRLFFSHVEVEDAAPPHGLHLVAKWNIRGRRLGAIFSDNLEPPVLQSTLYPRSIGRVVFRTVDLKTNPRLDCKKLEPGNGTLNLDSIFGEAIA